MKKIKMVVALLVVVELYICFLYCNI